LLTATEQKTHGRAAETSGWLMLARIGVLEALHRGVVREFNSDRKETHWGKRNGADSAHRPRANHLTVRNKASSGFASNILAQN
jgi:hypothetical protein